MTLVSAIQISKDFKSDNALIAVLQACKVGRP